MQSFLLLVRRCKLIFGNVIETLVVKIVTDATALSEGLAGVSKKIDKTGKTLTKKLTTPIVGLVTGIAVIGSNFEAEMSKVGDISGATGDDLERLTDKAKELGASTKFTAKEAAEALGYMAMSGWTVEEMLNGIDGVLDLAAASGENLATVADIVSDAMTAFGMEASDSSEFADVLAATAANANTDVGTMGETFKYVAPIAGALGYDIKDTAVAIGLMANAGIKGSQAGTGLRGILTSLIDPTSEAAKVMEKLGIEMLDSDGNIKPLEESIGDLRVAFADLTEAEKVKYASSLVGQNAMSGLLAIVNASESDYNKLTFAINNSTGAAAEMASQMQNNLKGKFNLIKSGAEGLALTFYDLLLPAFNKGADTILNFIDFLAGLDESTQKTILVIAGLVAAIGPLLIVVGKVMAIGGKVIVGIGKVKVAIGKFKLTLSIFKMAIATAGGGLGGFGKALLLLTGPVGKAVLAIGGLTAGGIALYRHLNKEVIPEIDHFGDGVSEATKKATESFLDMNEQVLRDLTIMAITGQEITEEMSDNIVGNISKMAGSTKIAINDTKEDSLEALRSLFEGAKDISLEEQEAILESTRHTYAEKIRKVEEAEEEITRIMELALEEKRELTDEERNIIINNKELIATEGIRHMTDSEIEQKVILERMKQNASDITAQQAAEVVRNSIEQKEKVIQEAEDQYDKVIAEIIKQRDVTGSISEEQANMLIAEAKRQKEETIASAEEMHKRVVEQAKQQANEHVNMVNWETGQILNKWQGFRVNMAINLNKLSNNMSKTWEDIKLTISNAWSNIKTSVSEGANNVKIEISKMLEDIRSWFVSLPSEALNWGKNMIQGFIDGINSMISSVGNAVSNVTRGVSDFLGFNSPARKGEGRNIVKWGYNMIDGFVDGINSAKSLLDNTLEDYIPNMNKNFSNIELEVNGLSSIYKSHNEHSPNTFNEPVRDVNINLEGMFRGADLEVRNDQDIVKISEMVVKLIQEKASNENRSIGLGGI